ncbi:heptaprenyl diphosphate synthase component 2 [Paenibacillus sp. J23TS9]|uniref:polyprenyl synthetase family protein n=1 Tax=Paenibacillus sp. J23TS9 TaxID=2807193 RepID=UPI001B1ADCB2|nr:polyprenyl synthetase family protein [Paenibacillus sp. J23TS9]GIP28209.1 heptaprenyl diphosphate synthase component 2 [Paenibacillus sp. J23TS9]
MKPSLHEALQIDIKRINREIENIIQYDKDVPRTSVLARSVLQLIRSGGKRLRPMLVIAGSRFGSAVPGRRQLQLAAAAEFIHAASLIHDDIIDRSDLRRGAPSLHTQTGVAEAVHIGNYMSARVVELLAVFTSDHDRFVHDLSSLATAQLCIGEYAQLEHAYDYDLSLAQYLEKTRCKTAQLMATCLRVGALSADVQPETAGRLYRFGESLGMAFQIEDDILDFTATAESLGKPAGSDLRRGQVTLPVLYALTDPVLAPHIRAIQADSSEEQIEYVLQGIRSGDALAQSEQMRRHYLQEAKEAAEPLRGHPAYEQLEVLQRYFGGKTA